MKFSIITPTYKRPELVVRAVHSAIDQSHNDWEMIIINDSPNADYKTVEQHQLIQDTRIKYIKNSQNKGVNFSRNRGLEEVSLDVDFVIFLDDDDYLAPRALKDLQQSIEKYPGHKFYISKRVFIHGNDLTIIPKFFTTYSYMKDVLIFKKIKRDFTAIVSRGVITENHIRYSEKIKQAEELIFWHQLSTISPMFALSLGTTITEGYLPDGLTHNKDSKMQRLKQTLILYQEAKERNILDMWFIVYLFLRVGAIVLR